MRRLLKRIAKGKKLTAAQKQQLEQVKAFTATHSEYLPYLSLPYSVAALHRKALVSGDMQLHVSVSTFHRYRPYNVRGSRKEICVCPECEDGH